MSKINVNTIEPQCGTTLTIGASNTSIKGIGTVNWCTTAKTSPLTSVSGRGYFINTTSGAITVTLPASPSAGDIVAFKDYANTWDTNAVTLCRNSSKINGSCNNATLNTESQSVTLIYVDGTKGWQDINDSTSDVTGVPAFIAATGGTVTTCGDFKIHTFTSDGTFTINTAPTPANNNVSYMVVAGGGGGAGQETASSAGGGGGGAGGFREGKTPATPYTASPLVAPAGLPVSVQAYPVTVGGGGATWSPPFNTACSRGGNGSNSVFSTITSAGGGGGGARTPSGPSGATTGANGGSGGGPGGGLNLSGGTGNTPPTSPAQGTNGGSRSGSPIQGASGGGGATVAGTGGCGSSGGVGGTGATTSISGSSTAYAGGGGGGDSGDSQAGGTGGGGPSGTYNSGNTAGGPPESNGVAGTANTGGGGGGAGGSCAPYNLGGAGGSGIVIIRYKFQ